MKPRMQRPFTATLGRQRGAVMVLIVIALASMLLMGALALDGGHMLLNKTRLQNAVDAAALSGAKTLSQVSGVPTGYLAAVAAARNTLAENAYADGNGELADAVDTPGFVINVEFSDSVYGRFDNPPPSADPRYVRVSVPDYPLVGFLWGVLDMFGSGDLEKSVAAIATAGPSPSAMPCKIEPIMVCGDPGDDPMTNNDPDSYWGYGYGDLEVLKSAAGNEPMAEGNFQLLRLDGAAGANDLRTALAGGIEKCNVLGEEVPTEPGNTVGPVAQGLNTRFGVYNGPGMNATDYPPDWVTQYNDPKMTYNDSTSPPRVEYQGVEVTPGATPGDLVAGETQLYDLNDWEWDSTLCAESGTCEGAYERRMLNIVIGNCTDLPGGQIDVPVLDVGCFYLLQTVAQQGVEAQVFGQFVKECEGDGVAGSNPADDVGPNIIQLYKTYLDCESDLDECPPRSPDS